MTFVHVVLYDFKAYMILITLVVPAGKAGNNLRV